MRTKKKEQNMTKRFAREDVTFVKKLERLTTASDQRRSDKFPANTFNEARIKARLKTRGSNASSPV